VQAFWTQLYCRVLTLSPEEHDRKIARISHLPHAIASMLTLAALRRDPTAAQCTGNGFRDSTRIAAGDPDLWTGILTENRGELLAGLEDAAALTQELLAIVRSHDNESLRHFLTEAQQLRSSVPSGAPNYGND
jgi:prephenate dehydrogenase